MSDYIEKRTIETFNPHPFKFLELPLDVIETDSSQPRKSFGLKIGHDFSRLMKSIKHYGIEDPIKVSEKSEGRYVIMDGHRRFLCAKELKFKTVPCRVYPNMSEGEFEARRFEMQNNRRSWKPIEKANAIHRIKSEYGNLTQKEIAELIGIKPSKILYFAELRDMRMEYLELMSEYNLKEYQRVGFVRLLPKLRKIKQFQIDDIVKILFQKIGDHVLQKEMDFMVLYRVFTVASLYEEEISNFLSVSAMTAGELRETTHMSGLSTQIKNLTKELSTKRSLDIKLTEKERIAFESLYKIMETFA